MGGDIGIDAVTNGNGISPKAASPLNKKETKFNNLGQGSLSKGFGENGVQSGSSVPKFSTENYPILSKNNNANAITSRSPKVACCSLVVFIFLLESHILKLFSLLNRSLEQLSR